MWTPIYLILVSNENLVVGVLEPSKERLLKMLLQIWRFEIISIDQKPLTVGKLAVAFVVFIVGFIIIKKLTNWVTRRFINNIVEDKWAAASIEALTFYFLLVFIFLFSMNIANIPLTIFTVIGGALAIGVGFGSQNILKNFISGIILMFDRPIKVGDFVEISGIFGQVEKIGFRSTRILSFGNRHLIFPNSTFLENDFINWTLTNSEVRFHVTVGVVYGSPLERVTELLIKAANENDRVLKTPEPPRVLFHDFGDNALIFELYFTIRIRSLVDRKVIESEIRYSIDRLFREEGIVIAFPQRDTHLYTSKPIEVKMVPERVQ